MSAQPIQSQLRIKNPVLVGEGGAVRPSRIADDGPFYVYSPGEAIHRVQAFDGTPHIYAGEITPVYSWGHWIEKDKSAEGSIGTREIKMLHTPNQRVQVQSLNPIYAGEKLQRLIEVPDAQLGSEGYGNKYVVSIEALAHKPAWACQCGEALESGELPDRHKGGGHAVIDLLSLDRLNALIQPLPLAFERPGHSNPMALYDDIPARRIAEYRATRGEIMRLSREHGGLLRVRQHFLNTALDEVATDPSLGELRELWMAAIIEMQTALERYISTAFDTLQGLDSEIEDARNGNHDRKKSYDPYDRMIQSGIGYKPQAQAMIEAVNKTPIVQVMQPGLSDDIARRACPTCGEMVAVTAKRCRYCSDTLVIEVNDGSNHDAAAPDRSPRTPRKPGSGQAS